MENIENMPDNTQECPNSGKMPENGKNKGSVGYCKPPVEHQFKPGEVHSPGHPAGQPNTVAKAKRSLLKDLLKELEKGIPEDVKKNLKKHYPDEDIDNMDQGTGLMKRLVMVGHDGDPKTILEILAYTDGKPKQDIDLGGQKENPIRLFNYDKVNPDDLRNSLDTIEKAMLPDSIQQPD
jgi:hypothetical protein